MLLIKNIKELVQVEKKPKQLLRGEDMATLKTVSDAFLLIDSEKIEDFGDMADAPESADEVIDATGKMVFPCWCDSHTHLVFAGSREMEFVDRINGLTYEEIAAKGGGILNSAKRLNEASEDELFEAAKVRLEEVMRMGTGAIEIKSGYGLTVEGELKMLKVIKRLKQTSPVTIKATFLGAHAIPAEYKQNRRAYISKVTEEMLPLVAKEGLAEYIDVFCERNYFTKEELDEILKAGAYYNLKPKIHVNQFSVQGGIPIGVENGAVSVDHLEVVDDKDIESLKDSNTICTLLPSCSFFLNLEYGPARWLLENNLPVALATDFNPGSTPSGNIPFVLSLACIKMKMTPEEAINAATINGAASMELSGELGSIAKGKKANVFITKPMPSVAFLPYYFGHDMVETVILNGKVI